MLQDPIAKPPDVQQQLDVGGMPARTGGGSSTTDRRSKPNSNSVQVLKCPRCESMNTKFCYYNNYSLTQPRHFCKNCRRYWTQGGALRNVPIGGGCRKNKRVKQRTVDPSMLPGLDESASMLASLSGRPGSCSALLHSFGAGSSHPDFGHVPPHHQLGGPQTPNGSNVLSLAFSRLQESFQQHQQQQQQQQQGLYPPSLGQQTSAGLLSLINNMPPSGSSYDNGGLVYANTSGSVVKPEPGSLLYPSGSELGSMFEPHAGAGSSATATLATLEDQLSSFGTLELEQMSKFQHKQQLALQLGADLHSPTSADHHPHNHHHHHHHHAHPRFEDEDQSALRRAGAAKVQSPVGKWNNFMAGDQGRMGAAQADNWPHAGQSVLSENLYEATAAASSGAPDQDSQNLNFWNHSGWVDVGHPLATSAAGTIL